MNIWDIAIILIVAVALFFAVKRVLRTRKSGGCGCAGCDGNCVHAKGKRG